MSSHVLQQSTMATDEAAVRALYHQMMDGGTRAAGKPSPLRSTTKAILLRSMARTSKAAARLLRPINHCLISSSRGPGSLARLRAFDS